MNKYLYFCRKAFNRVIASKNESSLDYLPNRSSGVFDTAHLVLRLLPSRDGIVLRKLLMTAVSEFEPETFHEILSYFYECFFGCSPAMRFHLMLCRYFWSGLWHHCLSFYLLTMNWTHFAFQQTEWSFINPSNGFQRGNICQTAALQSYCWCTISLDDSNFWTRHYGNLVRFPSKIDQWGWQQRAESIFQVNCTGLWLSVHI